MAMSAGSKPSLVFFLVFFAHAFCFVLACSKLGNCMFSDIKHYFVLTLLGVCVCVVRPQATRPADVCPQILGFTPRQSWVFPGRQAVGYFLVFLLGGRVGSCGMYGPSGP